MKNIRSTFAGRAILAAWAVLPLLVHAATPMESGGKKIPEALQPWEAWATWGDEDRLCPTTYSNSTNHLCFWPSRLFLQIDPTGGKFDLEVTVFKETWVPLPGGHDVWPMNVMANGVIMPVLQHEGNPAIKLSPGKTHLEGSYQWHDIPQRIPLPKQIGILSLILNGQPVDAPVWDAQGDLWLKRNETTEQAEKNFLSVKLYAALEDGIPLWLDTEVELTVAGKSREEELGTVLPEGWKLASVDSPIPVLIDDAGKMKAQVRAGKWTLHARAFRLDNPKEFRYAEGAKPPVNEELVAFRAQPDFRTVEIAGPPSIDVSQTTFPEQWRNLPVYRWDTGTTFRLEERMRGMGEQKTDGLGIARELWLDENGQGLTFRDHISGQMQRIWRLDAAEGQDLGSVRSGGQGQLITRNPQNGATGVEIRTRTLELEATGRASNVNNLSATGWRSDADSLSVKLNLPPGWRLFALFGADWVRGDWLTAWTLLDLFLLLLFSLAVFRMWGFGAGLLAFAGFGLSYQEPGAPRYVWLILIVPLALQRVAPEGWGRRIVGWGKWIAIAAFVLVFVPFIAQQVEQAVYPQLEVTTEFSGARFAGFGGFAPKAGMPPPLPNDSAEMNEQAPMPAAAAPAEPAVATSTIRRKLEHIIIPKMEFRDATLTEAIAFLKAKSVEYDDQSPDGEKGVNIILNPGSAPNAADARITVSLTNIPLIEALKYVTGLASCKFKVEPFSVTIVPSTENTDVLVTKEWKVPSEIIPNSGDPNSAKNWLVAGGVTFNGGASALYVTRANRLIVRNTQDQLDLIDTILSEGAYGGADAARRAPAGRSMALLAPAGVALKSSASDNLGYDAKARIQTGPGVPEWNWREVSFGWNGPVAAAQQVRPVLISLTLERILTILRVALLLALVAVLLRMRKFGGSIFRGSRKFAMALLFARLVSGASGQTPIPDQATLDKLRERLLEVSDAYPNAADIPLVSFKLTDRKITIDAEIHAAIRCGVPLPGRLPTWSPLTVLVDGKPEVALRREDDFLWFLVEPGVHHVHVEGSLANVTEWQWTFLLRPRQVKIEAPDWTVSGVSPNGVPEVQVFFVRKQKKEEKDAGAASYDQQKLQAIAEIDRTVEIGLVWQVHTTVRRLSSPGKAVALRIPLLPGENVLSAGTTVKDGFIEVRMGAQDLNYSWESNLATIHAITLATRPEDGWVEGWSLIVSPIWNVTITGLPPTFEPGNTGLVPSWHPWPGESVTLAISRPEAIAGATVTVHKAQHEIELGKRERTAKLDLSLLCSLGGDFPVELPADAGITALTLDEAPIPVRKDGNKLIIPVHPGEQKIGIAWKTNIPLTAHAEAGEVHLPVESANIQTVIHVPEDRWVLWVHGPQRGPAVRFWGILLCSLLAAIALGRLTLSPLRTIEWTLLAIGLTQVPLPAALAVVGWLFLLVWRQTESFQQRGNISYNLLQLFLIAVTAIALGILVTAVGEGLLGSPEMFITGNGSTRTELNWFLPRSQNSLPRPGCFSISIWWYRFLMLLWALWLAGAVIRWLRHAWQAFGTGGYFHRKPKKATTPPPLPTQPPQNA